MKKKRNLLVGLLVMAIMFVGIGYAALSSTLGLKGTLTYTPDFAIEWKADSVEVDGASVTSTIADVEEVSTLSFTVDTSDWTAGDAHTITAVIENNSNYDATNITVSAVSQTTDTVYTISVADIADIAADGEGTVTITITLDEYPEAATDYTEVFSFTITAEQDV